MGIERLFRVLQGSLSRSYHKTNFLGLANTENQVLEGQSLVLKINVPLPDSKLEPYVFVGGGRYHIGDSNGPYYRGSSIEYGIGMDLAPNPCRVGECRVVQEGYKVQ